MKKECKNCEEKNWGKENHNCCSGCACNNCINNKKSNNEICRQNGCVILA